MANNGANILSDAIARNSAIVLSLPSAGMLRHHKTRFLSEEETGFWIESVPDDRILVDALINEQKPVGISFRSGPQKVSFAVPMIQRSPEFKVNADTTVEAIKLNFPADVKATQRRSNYRVRVPEGTEMTVRLWRVAEHFFLTDKPMASQELITKMRDISIGGMGVMLEARNGEGPRVLAGERLRILLKYKEMEELIIEGRIRYLPPDGATPPIRAGIQFKKLENNLEGRQALAILTRIVGELQRDEVRRTRLGIKAA
jgi:c-di-GMP-binding flagellar brake protein YcgR